MSTLKVDTLKNTSGVEVYTAKAWVNFNGTGTVAIRGSGNVSSITDNGAGDYTINFINSMPDANYAVATDHQGDSIGFSGSVATRVEFISSQSASNFTIFTGYQYAGGGSGKSDSPIVCCIVSR